jgi:hypothetical protein
MHWGPLLNAWVRPLRPNLRTSYTLLLLHPQNLHQPSISSSYVLSSFLSSPNSYLHLLNYFSPSSFVQTPPSPNLAPSAILFPSFSLFLPPFPFYIPPFHLIILFFAHPPSLLHPPNLYNFTLTFILPL